MASNRLIQRFGTGWVTAGSTALVTLALFGFSFAGAFWQLCLLALPYGLGAGSIDAALNNYVALHYKSRQMSWIHFFWGVGATAGPTIMGWCLTGGAAWNSGYRIIGSVQLVMTVVLVLTLPLWQKNPAEQDKAAGKTPVTEREALRLPGAKAVLTAFFCYCALEIHRGFVGQRLHGCHSRRGRGKAPPVGPRCSIWASRRGDSCAALLPIISAIVPWCAWVRCWRRRVLL